MKNLSRRSFIQTSSILAAATVPTLRSAERASSHPDQSTPRLPDPKPTSGPTQLYWLEGENAQSPLGTAFGVAWPIGKQIAGTKFSLKTVQGHRVPVQSWITATWPDGSIKWTGHAIGPDSPEAEGYIVEPGNPLSPQKPVQVIESATEIAVDTGVVRCRLPRSGNAIISQVKRDGVIILKDGHLCGSRQDSPEKGVPIEVFQSSVNSIEVEQSGPVRAVLKVKGMHRISEQREWLPFSLRLYFHAGSECIRITHTFVFDGDENDDFITSLGMRFNVPLRDQPYDRHVRFAGQEKGLWAEAIQGLTGLRRDPGPAVRKAQIDGRRVPHISNWDKEVSTRLHWVPTWSDFSLSQLNANGFSIKKRTKAGQGWVDVDQGQRSNGLGYVGDTSGGVVFGMRDFWQLHPTQLDIRDAATDSAQVTLWIYSPDAPPMDIRFYHDGLDQGREGPLPEVKIEGIESSVPNHPYEKQVDALRVTYEDYEPGFGTPKGVARSSDIYLWAVGATPNRLDLSEMATSVANPPQLVPRPGDLYRAEVFSNMWNLPNRTSPALARIEERLDWSLRFYQNQIEQRHWYGFWNYGDVMHTYDADRHVWRYDIGGFAWDNSELSTDMWLWYSFLRSGDPTAFRLAEAMNRHNRDVDIYHLGRFAGLGTRHNVQHWGCSAKQLRISTCMNRRFHYFLTTDERTGDVLQEVAEADSQLAELNARRKVSFDSGKTHLFEPAKSDQTHISVGTDYGAAVSNWLTAWERTGDLKYKTWIESSMRVIGRSKWGFFTNRYEFDPVTKKMTEPEDQPPAVSHLSIMFGLPEVLAELIQLVDIPEFAAAWIKYCELCNAPADKIEQELGLKLKNPGFVMSHSRIVAYAAHMNKDGELAKQAASNFIDHHWAGIEPALATQRISGPQVLNPIEEAPWVSTNQSAQWGLAAIQTSALIPTAIGQHESS